MIKQLIRFGGNKQQLHKFIKTRLFSSTLNIQTEKITHNYNLNFESLNLKNPETVKKVESKIISKMELSDQIVEWINCLESSWNQKHKETFSEILTHLKSLENSFSGIHFQLLISFLETVEFELTDNDYQEFSQERLKLEKLVLGNLQKIEWKDINFFEEKRIKNALGFSVEEDHGEKKIMNILVFWADNNKDDFAGKFVRVLSILEYYFSLKNQKQAHFQKEIRTILKNNLNLFSVNRFIKFLTFCDFYNELFDVDLKFEIEKKIADILKDEIQISQVGKLISFLSKNNQLFRQKLIFVVNEAVQNKINELSFKNKIELLYLNSIYEIPNNKNLPTLESSDILKEKNPDLILKLKFLQFSKFESIEHLNAQITEKFNLLNLKKLRTNQLLKVYMFLFHEGKFEVADLLQKEILGSENLEFNSLKSLVLEVCNMWEKELINFDIWENNFMSFFDHFMGNFKQNENISRDEKLFLRDYISQITSKYDEIFEDIN